MNRAYIAFGSNLGDSLRIIDRALSELEKNEINVTGKSGIYKTKPYGYKEQPDFLNGVIEVNTKLGCRELLEKLLSIEAELGRVRQIHWGPRVIDLDIIFFNSDIYNEEDLIVPHPDMHNREFVIKPMCDINPGFIHPILGRSVEELLKDLE